MADLYYTIVLEYDGRIFRCEYVSEGEAKEWLWRILSRPTVEMSRIVIRQVRVELYDGEARQFGVPGDVDPMGRPLRFG